MTAAKSKPVNPYDSEGGDALGKSGVGAGEVCHLPCARQLFGPVTDSQETLVLGEEVDQPCVLPGPKNTHDTDTKDDKQVVETPKTEQTPKSPTHDSDTKEDKQVVETPGPKTEKTTKAQTHDTKTKNDKQVVETPKIEEATQVGTHNTQGDTPPQTPPCKKPMVKSPQANGDEIAPGKTEKPSKASSKAKAKPRAKAASSKVKAAARTTKKKHSKTQKKTEEQKVVHRAASKRWHDKWLKKGVLRTAQKLRKASKKTCNKHKANETKNDNVADKRPAPKCRKPETNETENDKAVDKRPAPPVPAAKRAKTGPSPGSDRREACEFLMSIVFLQTMQSRF